MNQSEAIRRVIRLTFRKTGYDRAPINRENDTIASGGYTRMTHFVRRRGLLLASLLFVAALALVFALRGGQAFSAKLVIGKVTCHAGFVAEGDKDSACTR